MAHSSRGVAAFGLRALRASGSALRGSASAAEPMLESAPATLPNVKDGKVSHPDLLNANMKKTQYAVRGELYLRAEELRRQGKEIIFTNVGNPQALGQIPLTFSRQVMALVTGAHFMLKDPEFRKLFKEDVIERAEKMMGMIPGGVGAYSDSRGALGIRQEVADYIAARDGVPAPNPDHIFLTDGASVAVRMGLSALIRNSNDGIMVPIPQYPLYSASIQLYGGTLIPYALDESKGWSMDIPGMTKVVEDARAAGKNVRAMVFINPGNPTGQCLSKDNLKELVKFAYDQKIILLCDEVYQENIYQDERPFVSARAVAHDMGEPYRSGLEMMCFHTVSKGAVGECGLRGGYVEMVNIHQGAVDEVYKIASINLSPNVPGQVAMSLMVNPPKPGMPSYEAFKAEKQLILDTLRERAHIMTDGFNSLEGVTCNFTEGAMYSFPQIRLSDKAMAAAAEAGKPADVFYCLKLLEATGISTVPGSGFGQAAGTFHLRTTILPPVEKMKEVVARLQKFHAEFMDQYR